MNMRQRKRALYVRNYHELLVAEIIAELEDAANILLASMEDDGQSGDAKPEGKGDKASKQ